MAWVNVPGLAGNVYVPNDTGQVQKKHPCKGCFSCQWCDENRCQVCRGDFADTSACASTRCCCGNTIGRHQQIVPNPLIANKKKITKAKPQKNSG